MKKLFLFLFIAIWTANASAQEKASPEILKYVEQMPRPMFDVREYYSTHFEYPEKAIKNNKEGQVRVKFIVALDGTLDSVHAEADTLGYGLEEAAVKLVKNMPPWQPGKQNDKSVRVYFTQPVTFKLTD